MKKIRLIALSSLAILGFSANSAALWAQGRNDIIAQTGQAAPDGIGTLSSFGAPVLNDSGQTAFIADLTGTGGNNDTSGIFRGSGGSITQIARRGRFAPGNGLFWNFGSPVLNNSGETAFTADLIITLGGNNDNSGIFLGSGGSITQIAREGQSASGNGTFSIFGNPVLNDSGQTAFRADLIGTNGNNDNSGIFRGSGGSVIQIVRKGHITPDLNGYFSGFGAPALSNLGQAAFWADLTGTSRGSADNEGIFRGNGGSITQIAREGQVAPDLVGIFAAFGAPVLNNSGQAAFRAELDATVNNVGIFRGSGGSITQIARKGQAALDANGTYSNFGSPVLNASGQAAFWAELTGTSGGTGDNSGIYRGNGGMVTQIAREGQVAPDSAGIFSSFGNPVLNDSGQTAFSTTLTGTSGGTSDDSGIFTGDGIDLFQVAREGDTLGGSTITSVSLASSGTLNYFGQIAYQASLNNGQQVISRWTPDLHWRGTTSNSWDTAGRWTLSLKPGSPHDVFIDPAASLTVTGPATNTTVRGLQIGGGTGLATLNLGNGATLTATNGVTIASTGTLTGDGSIAGNVFNNGNVLADNITVAGSLTNNRVISGNGRIHANIINNSAGEIRASNGNHLLLTGSSLTNAGRIEVINGELEVSGNLNNVSSTGLIAGRNATMRFNGGLANAGSLGITVGTSDVFGEIVNTGTINVSGGATATFYDDVAQNGVMQIASVGNTNSAAVFFGGLSGGGFVGGGDVFALGDLRPGFSPASVLYDGNLFLGNATDTFIELAGLGLGEFDQMRVTGDLNLAGDLLVSLIDGHMLGAGQQYLIGDIAGMLSGQFNGLGEGSLVGVFSGYQTFITYTAGNGNDIALFTAIPEPGTPVLFALLSLLMVARRQRKLDA